MGIDVRGFARLACRGGLGAALVAASLVAGGGGASAVVTVGDPVVGSPGFYDYSPTAIAHGTTEDFWWCGDLASHVGDTILHEQYSTAGGVARVTEPERAVLQETPGAWDSLFTCNADVVEGSFANPLGNGVTYTYAMYYVGTTNQNGNNSIGVAFSNDGLSWTKYPSPVLQYIPPAGSTVYYGYAQPNAYDPGGGSAVTLLYEVGEVGNSHVEVTSTDGVHFSNPQTITSAGLPNPTPSWGGVAYNEQDGRWYAAFNAPGRPATMTGGVGERGGPGVTLYSTGNLISGTWTALTTVDTNLTGYEQNFIAGLLRQPDGALNGPSLPNIELLVSTSLPRPAANATPAQAAGTAGVNNWDVVWSIWTPGSPLRGLYRYYSNSLATHEVTTGWVDQTTFHYESTLGYLYEAPTGAATVPWYGCKGGGTDYFVSLDPNCEGQFYLGLDGYGSAQPGAGETALYRCYTGVDHFVSTDPNCEGQKTELLLGYAQTEP